MTTPTTEAREREAREATAARLCVFAWSIDGLGDPSLDELERQRIHDLAGWVMRERTAILAAYRARVRAVVENAPGYQRQGLFVSRADILQRLDAEPTP